MDCVACHWQGQDEITTTININAHDIGCHSKVLAVACHWLCGISLNQRLLVTHDLWNGTSRFGRYYFSSTFPSIPQGPSDIQPQCKSASATVIHNQVRCRPSNKNTVRLTCILSQRPWRLEQYPHWHQTHWLTTFFPTRIKDSSF